MNNYTSIFAKKSCPFLDRIFFYEVWLSGFFYVSKGISMLLEYIAKFNAKKIILFKFPNFIFTVDNLSSFI